jgi:formamidopyrimidine-DNA glycosylase
MPELPEVEVVRRGLEPALVGRRIGVVDVLHPRAVRRHLGGPHDFGQRLDGLVIDAVRRRGKYLWLPLVTGDGMDATPAGAGSPCIVGHLGMSGQLLVQPASAPVSPHLRVRVRFRDDGPELRFVDQRTFGGLMLDELVPANTGAVAVDSESIGTDLVATDSIDTYVIDTVPAQVAHIARDPIDPGFDETAWIARARRSDSAIKRTLLDQTLISGVGNIYADEALWRAGLHGQRRASSVEPIRWRALSAAIRAVLSESLAQGGTSFDALYVNVNGESGYFSRDLNVYGREGQPCRRCGTPIRRSPFMNRSSYWCPRCQPAPRSRRAV